MSHHLWLYFGHNKIEKLPHTVPAFSPSSLASDITQICRAKYLIYSVLSCCRSGGNFPLMTEVGQIYMLPWGNIYGLHYKAALISPGN